ncbi:hypothetical protein ABLN67_12395, partial [Mycobacterium tuberculosis]
PCGVRFIRFGCLTRFIYRREWSFRIYRETLSRFSCAASPARAAATPSNTKKKTPPLSTTLLTNVMARNATSASHVRAVAR